jgi:hypothetical protein
MDSQKKVRKTPRKKPFVDPQIIVKSKLLKLERGISKEEKRLLRDAKKFFAFSLFLIVAVLLYYSRTGDEIIPFLALFATAAVFWEHSDKRGKIFMVAAASLGFAHEVVGGMEGWFVYNSGAFFQTPIWLIPGYAAMYWACYNLWKRGYEKHMPRPSERDFLVLSACIIALLFALTLRTSASLGNSSGRLNLRLK